MNTQGEYIKQLEEIIGKFLEPIKCIPFSMVIKVLTGCCVLTFDPSLEENRKLLNQLSKAAEYGAKKAFKKGIFTKRPNEAGNAIEPFVIEALEEAELKANRPISKSGKKKVAGYPDIEIEDQYGRIIYLDCKTYSQETKNQSFRTFYFSPSEDPKITKDAFHILMSFELKEKEKDNKKVFVPISWQIYTLDKLKVQVKHEFNASNKELYTKEALLAHGEIKEEI